MKKTYYVTFNKGICRVVCKEKDHVRMSIKKWKDGRYHIFDYTEYEFLAATFALLPSAIVYAWDVLKVKEGIVPLDDKEKEVLGDLVHFTTYMNKKINPFIKQVHDDN